MNYDFLRTYGIPLRNSNSTDHYHTHREEECSSMTPGYGVMVSSTQHHASPIIYTGYEYEQNPYAAYYENSTILDCSNNENRMYCNERRSHYTVPENHGPYDGGYVTYHNKAYKRKYSSVSSERVAHTSMDGSLVIFQGRHKSYPNELNQLIHPLSCDVCQVKMNSMLSAKDHYESKVHDRHLTMWLKKNYTDKGFDAPPVKRFLKQGPTGPEAYYCEPCDIHLTSFSHATQHYSGRKHRSVVSRMGNPSSSGYYDTQGKWISSNLFKYADNGRVAIVDQMKQCDYPTTEYNTSTIITSPSSSKPILIHATQPARQAEHLYCSLCNVHVTSAIQMTMHLNGTKHKKKVQQKESGEETTVTTTTPTTTANTSKNVSDTVLSLSKQSLLSTVLQPDSTISSASTNVNDMSMYRTPSGQYYCKMCNITMTNTVSLQQHLTGKRHTKSQMEKRAKAVISHYGLNG